ncbi:MAG: threonine--tRNA ligase [Candidatus Buchananbacteria bacterium]|nr:threonine--tRNA ligase [Candidatus Buchananbacteria bacterium]
MNIDHLRHSLAHLLAAAILELYPDTKPTIGPAIENGFYYDFQFGTPISDKELPKIEKRMKQILKHWKTFEGVEVSAAEAREKFAGNQFKLELIDEIESKGEKITLYTSGQFTDLCRGGHVDETKAINADAFKLDRVAGAYWRGDEKNPMLTRIYGLAFESKEELDAFLVQREEAEKRDHKKLGKELDLYFIDEQVGQGLPMWTPKGTAIKFELENFTRELERQYGYEHVSTPYLGAEALYKTSGHLEHYASNMYAPIDMDGDLFYLRPMACPHHIRMFQRRAWSYRDLPIRYAEIADYNRYEKSGELMGMIRVRKFQLTDAHIFVTPEGLKDEFKQVCALIQAGMRGLGLDQIVSYRFSKRDPNNKEKYYPNDELWNKAESMMKTALDEVGIDYIEAEDEAAFYGPKIDVQAKNANGKEDTLFTAQIDFLLPEKFDIEYIDQDGQKKRPVMIHRSAIGSLERTFAFLIEHYAGVFPLWLSPVQAVVIPVSEKFDEYAQKITKELKAAAIRVELDNSAETLGKRIRNAEQQKTPYILVVGEKEVEAGTVAVRKRGEGDLGALATSDFIANLTLEITNRQ